MSRCTMKTSRPERRFLGIYVLFAVLAVAAQGAMAAQPLLQSRTTWEGSPIQYPDGEAQVTAVILSLAPEDAPAFHCHPVPTMGYVLEGELEVETSDGKTSVFRQGQAVVEVMRTVHRGRALNGSARIVVFYAGAVDMPTTVLPADDPRGRYCDV